MMTRVCGLLLAAVLAALPVAVSAQGKAKYSIKTVDAEAPKELAADVKKLLSGKCVQVLDAKGNTMLELWFRKEVPVKATAAQIKNGLTYKEVPSSTLVGVVRVPKSFTDYRKQSIKAGTYTLRYGQQPQDGDHMGTAPYNDFLVLSPAKEDKKPELMEVKDLQELSGKTTEAHPSMMLLWPGTGAAKEAKLADKGEGHWVILIELPAASGQEKAALPLGVTVVGVSSSA